MFLVTVSDPPSTEVKQRDSGNPVEGSSFTLTCSLIDGNPRDDIKDVMWRKDNSMIVASDHYQLSGLDLTIRSLNHSRDDGLYSCAAENVAGVGLFSEKYQLLVFCKYRWNCR